MTERKLTRSEMKRQAILDAAREAFQECGVQGTSMDKLAAMAQVSKRTVYNHFETKEALVMQLMREMWQQTQQGEDICYSAEKPLDEQLIGLLSKEIAVLSYPAYIELSRVAFGYFFYHPEALQKELAKYSKAESAVYRWLEGAVTDGRLKQMDIEFATNQLYSMIKGCCFWGQLIQAESAPDEQEQKRLAEETAAMFLSHYRA